MPSTETSPRPWRITHPGEIEDANGNLLYNLRDCIGGGVDEANAVLIVDAVNTYAIKSPCRVCSGYAQKGGCIADERDRLRDIVRRFVDLFTPGTIHHAGTRERLIREARAAIGEDAP